MDLFDRASFVQHLCLALAIFVADGHVWVVVDRHPAPRVAEVHVQVDLVYLWASEVGHLVVHLRLLWRRRRSRKLAILRLYLTVAQLQRALVGLLQNLLGNYETTTPMARFFRRRFLVVDRLNEVLAIEKVSRKLYLMGRVIL